MKQVPPAMRPSFKEAFLFWLKLGFISFGGPGGQIAIMHNELVEKKKWISEDRFLHALNFCMLLPGPEAQQLATYLGWLLHRTAGGLAAGLLFILPSIFILWGLSAVYVYFGMVPWIAAIFYGLKPAVLAVVLAAAGRIGRRALKNRWMWFLAAAAFTCLFFFKIPFPWVILGAACAGLAGGLVPSRAPSPAEQVIPETTTPARAHLFWTILIGLSAWWLPIFLAGLALGWQSTVFQAGLFFSKAAMVTFGGAYAVLPYVATQAVETYQWMKPEDVLAGMALAETTPGPLIMVLQFYGFLGGWNQPDATSLFWSASLTGFMATWATFAPCFLYIFAGAPYIERLRGARLLNAALSAVTAAVVGVILNLALWFGLHVLFPEASRSWQMDWVATAIALGALLGLHRYKLDILLILPMAAAAGLLAHWLR